MCPGASSVPLFILAFGEDDGGEVYMLGTAISNSNPAVPPTAAIYQITDPKRHDITLHPSQTQISTHTDRERENPQCVHSTVEEHWILLRLYKHKSG